MYNDFYTSTTFAVQVKDEFWLDGSFSDLTAQRQVNNFIKHSVPPQSPGVRMDGYILIYSLRGAPASILTLKTKLI